MVTLDENTKVEADQTNMILNETATSKIYTLSLHDALPIFERSRRDSCDRRLHDVQPRRRSARDAAGRSEGTRLNSSHVEISYAVFCLKKKKTESGIFFRIKKRKWEIPGRKVLISLLSFLAMKHQPIRVRRSKVIWLPLMKIQK